MKVFVYGTLKPKECNYLRYCEGKVVDALPAIARGQLFALPIGYPAMVAGEGIVCGFLLCFANSAILDDLDRLEDYHPLREPAQNEYQRQSIEICDRHLKPLGTAWAYFMLPDRVLSEASGCPMGRGKIGFSQNKSLMPMSLLKCHCRGRGRIEPVTETPNSFNKLRSCSINFNHFLANLTDMYANNFLFSCVVAVPTPDFFD